MNRKHLLVMVLGCAIPLAALLAVSLLQLQPSKIVLFGLFLLCPAMHLLMLRGHIEHGGAHGTQREVQHGRESR
jgi:hypothetical protein